MRVQSTPQNVLDQALRSINDHKGENMRKALILVAMLCLAAMVFAVDFSGTWVLNAEKSAAANPAPAGGGGGGGGRGGGGGGEMTIKMTATELSITRNMGGNEMVTAYKLDGKENTMNTGRGDVKYTATLKGETVVVESSQMGRDGTPTPMKTEYSISADGKTLTVATTRGENVRKQIYDKK
jgi:hypothetical protein